MSALTKLEIFPERAPQQQRAHELMPLLNRLRFLAISCRAMARVDMFQACQLLSDDVDEVQDSFAQMFVRVVNQATKSKFIFLAPGSIETSFHEDWLLRCFERLIAQDTDSYKFLTNSRVHKSHQSVFHALLLGVLENTKRNSQV